MVDNILEYNKNNLNYAQDTHIGNNGLRCNRD